jgi:uncharacterized ferritin-like protein (DUF455 family)
MVSLKSMNSGSKLDQFARLILLGDRLEDKLWTFEGDFSERSGPASRPLTLLPDFPGRPKHLRQFGKAEFPKLSELRADTARGRVLHFFANHELLAMELMALVLLKFPDAPEAFKAGIVRTITEEQNHLKLYLDRMKELGVEFGELPVSDYFWNSMKHMSSPLQFVTQMSLTLEQANLDYSLFYRDAVASLGDAKTAGILDRVYREEIGHVKHGLTWFNRWRLADRTLPESDWEAYLALLPPPMTARRAKGLGFSAEARREAGLSEKFISELEVYSGSKGRPPVFWFYNPLCDSEIVRGKPGLTPSEPVRRLGLDLETLPMFLASDKDVVLVTELPHASWLRELQTLGFETPVFRKRKTTGTASLPRELKIGGCEPWGWSPEVFEYFKPWRSRLIRMEDGNGLWCSELLKQPDFASTGLGRFFSKAWSTRFLNRWLEENPKHAATSGGPRFSGEVFEDWPGARARIERSFTENLLLLAKAPWGTSGAQNKRILRANELEGPLGGWIKNTIESQGSIILEPWLEKIADLSIQLEITSHGVRLLGVRRFVTGPRLEYRGTYLDPKLSSLGAEALRYLHSPAQPLEGLRTLAQAVGTALAHAGYQGPAGIDAMLWQDPETRTLHLKPLVELNPRWTMGRIALELEKRVLPGTPAVWAWIEASTQVRKAATLHPPVLASSAQGQRIASGVLLTQDPERARDVLTALIVGEAVLREPEIAGLLGFEISPSLFR